MKVKVLVADSSSKVRKNMTRSLKEIGVQAVVEAADADTAIKLLEQEQFNAVLADGKIKTDSGKDFVEEIRDIDDNVPIIVTANPSEVSTAIQAEYFGATGFLPKPFTSESLREKLQEFVPAIAG